MSQRDWPTPVGLPKAQGLYDPKNEHDSCGIGFIANIKNRKSHEIVRQGIQILVNLDHRGAVGADPLAGDGAGILLQLPDRLFLEEVETVDFELPDPGDDTILISQDILIIKGKPRRVERVEQYILGG